MESFRRITNECIRIGLVEGKTTLKSLSIACYPKLKTYEVPSAYKLCAISKAAGILNHYRKLSRKHHVKEPYCSRLSLTTCYGIKVIDGKVRMPWRCRAPLERLCPTLPLAARRRSALRHLNRRIHQHLGSGDRWNPLSCTGMLGIDRNLDNVTVADTESQVQRFDLSKAPAVKAQCRQTKRGFRRNDVKVKKRLFTKYGRLERNRVDWLLHNVSANIVLKPN